jgi:hypothetical protein
VHSGIEPMMPAARLLGREIEQCCLYIARADVQSKVFDDLAQPFDVEVFAPGAFRWGQM